ncbi:MAG: hypothetical protein EZS28_020472 [Streblomastix strix]|uniref:Uncharacterized protein n=1 Tax=Streblomastix strix TaxID=222440 RepID=A0A5J4VN02_9EUKA|nr:MAG: hypothetical protein EZS28_020472 [Streblomastix strix]
MPAQLIERITDQDRCKALIYDTNRFSEDPLVVDKMLLFVAEIKGHTDEKYINEVINWAPILRNIDITTNRQTIGEFMYNHLVDHQLLHDKTERKLTNLIDTNNEIMLFNNYYLWPLIYTCHLIIGEIVIVTTFTKHTNFNSFLKEFINLRQQAKDAKNEGLGQFCKLILNQAFGGDALNSEKMHFVHGDTDSLTQAISGNPNRGPEQLFEEIFKDKGFFDRYKDGVFSENGKK